MKTNKIDMTKKIEITVEKTIEALARIDRFLVKYGPDLTKDQIKQISTKVKELQKNLTEI